MTIIMLVIFGFALLAFVIIFSSRHSYSVDKMMKQNHGVKPLLKERSAEIKYTALHVILKEDPEALQTLEQLHTDHRNKLTDVDAYHQALDELEQQHNKL